MVTSTEFKRLVLSFAEVTEQPHFANSSFQAGKKIFITLNEKEKKICIKLSETDQSVFILFDKNIIYPVANKWGKQGWTYIELTKIKKKMLVDAMTAAYNNTAPKRLTNKYKKD